jgi:hypothetical protein
MYSNNTEYRKALRTFFNMNVDSISATLMQNNYDYDDETLDELLFDPDSVNAGMSTILDKTDGNPLFDHLYSLAAGKMFSTDRGTGLCILLTYDFFSDFHTLWQLFSNDPSKLSDTTNCFVLLKNRLSGKK